MIQYYGTSTLREIYFEGNYFSDFTSSTFVELFRSMGRNRVQHCLRQCLKTALLRHAVMLAIYLESKLLFDELRVYCKARHTEAPIVGGVRHPCRDIFDRVSPDSLRYCHEV